MLRFFLITTALTLGIALAGCNRSPVQPVPAPSVHTSHPVDQVSPPQDTNVRVDADRGNVDVKVDRPGLLGDRKIEVQRDANGNVDIKRERDVIRDRDDRPLRDREVDVQVTPGQGVKVDLGK
jgi:hypothetical protein